jgi:hypothetical protein
MISLRLAVPAVLVAAAVVGCFAYFVAPPPQLEADERLPSTVPDMTGPDSAIRTSIDQRSSAEDQAAAFQRAADAILKRARDAQASAGPHETTITGHIPLPKRRPIQRP